MLRAPSSHDGALKGKDILSWRLSMWSACLLESEAGHCLAIPMWDLDCNIIQSPTSQHTKLPPDCCPLLVFVNPKSGGLKGRELLYSFRKLLNPHQVFELTNGGPLPG